MNEKELTKKLKEKCEEYCCDCQEEVSDFCRNDLHETYRVINFSNAKQIIVDAVKKHKREMGKLFEELEKVALSDGWDDGLDLVISSSDYKRIKEARLCEKKEGVSK